jgi:hypothetical protein
MLCNVFQGRFHFLTVGDVLVFRVSTLAVVVIVS